MSVYLVSGLFALGGVGLAGLFAEVRAARESHSRENSELATLKRETYSKGIHQVELVASKVARWIGANDEERAERSLAFWDELTVAYQITNEIRIIARTQEPADAMKRVLTAYRSAVENDDRELPKPRDLVAEMVSSFRKGSRPLFIDIHTVLIHVRKARADADGARTVTQTNRTPL